jgi:TolB-like protein/DNA-binding winged helix-turn-helix (wHTH) protein/Tfp pilus assembly protein PilF
VETAPKIIRFGLFELDTAAGELRKRGLKIRLADQPLQILLLLLECPGEVVSREAVRQRLWPAETFVDFDAGLNTAVKKLRDALGDPAENPRFVETLPRRGYRFIAPIETPPVSLSDSPPDEAPAAEIAAHSKSAGLPSWILVATTAVAVLIVASAWLIVGGWRERRSRSDVTAPAEIKSIVILPFENLSGDPGQEYFADGMTEALTTRLAQIRALRVISRTSAELYKGAKKSLPEVARELNVDAVVEGAVVRSGGRVRVTAQLIQAANDRHLWAQSYERELHDVLVLQADVARAIADAVQVEVRPGEQRLLLRARAVHPDAYEAYLWGRFYLKQRTRAALLKAVEQFQRAIEKDPTYAAAHSGLADTYRVFGLAGLPPREVMPKSEAAARQALALDDTLAEGHASLAGVLYQYRWNWSEAEKEFRRSLDLDPNYAEGHRAFAIYLLMLDRPEEAVSEARHAQELSPLDETINNELGTALAREGRYDEAITQLQKTREKIPKSLRAYAGLAEVYARQGDWSRAIATYEEGRPGPAAPWLGYMYAVSGRRPEALHVLAALEKRAQQDYVTPQNFAIVQLGLGRTDQALTLLEKAYDERAFEVLGFPLLSDLLRDEPRFRDLRRRMGLASQLATSPPSVGEAHRKR